jgi:hypothetical protein
VDLMLDIAAASSSGGGLTSAGVLGPLLQSLPPLGNVSSPYTLPASYLPHLANQQAVSGCSSKGSQLQHTGMSPPSH